MPRADDAEQDLDLVVAEVEQAAEGVVSLFAVVLVELGVSPVPGRVTPLAGPVILPEPGDDPVPGRFGDSYYPLESSTSPQTWLRNPREPAFDSCPVRVGAAGLVAGHARLGRPELVRQYSLCGDPANRSTWRLAVLKEPENRARLSHYHGQRSKHHRLRLLPY